MIWMKWSIDGSKLLTAFSIFAPPTAAGAQPIITIGSGNCSGARPGLLAVAAAARDAGAKSRSAAVSGPTAEYRECPKRGNLVLFCPSIGLPSLPAAAPAFLNLTTWLECLRDDAWQLL